MKMIIDTLDCKHLCLQICLIKLIRLYLHNIQMSKLKIGIFQKSIRLLLLICAVVPKVRCQQLLDGIPIVFKIDGNVEYIPTSGVTAIPGYKMKVGFDKNSWIGVKFMDKTSNSNFDILIVQRKRNPGGVYETTASDYFVSEGRPDKLISDNVNSMDKQAITLSESNYFFLEIHRPKGETEGEDWQGSQFLQICFLTSEKDFNIDQWSNLTQSCYGYSIDQFVSTYRGKKIGDMSVDGTNSQVYGGIQGPVLSIHLFWHCPLPTLSSEDVLIRIGAEIDPRIVGHDYYKCGSGDYFGLKSNDLTPDTAWNGYGDGECIKSSTQKATSIYYSRNVFTYDEFDAQIYNQTQFCLSIGTNNQCENLKLQILFPVMEVESAFKIYEINSKVNIIAILLLAMVII